MDTNLDLVSAGCLSVKDAVRISRLSRTYLYELMQAGKLAYLKVGNRRLIPRRALLDFLAGHVVDGHQT